MIVGVETQWPGMSWGLRQVQIQVPQVLLTTGSGPSGFDAGAWAFAHVWKSQTRILQDSAVICTAHRNPADPQEGEKLGSEAKLVLTSTQLALKLGSAWQLSHPWMDAPSPFLNIQTLLHPSKPQVSPLSPEYLYSPHHAKSQRES
jgi:hypothetical protein